MKILWHVESDMVYNFNEWRRKYDLFTYKEQQEEHSKIHREFPSQVYFNLDAVKKFLLMYKPVTVLEIGGHQGELAELILNDPSFGFIQKWFNIDICNDAVESGLKNERYYPYVPDTWAWEITLPEATAFVSSNFIEHIKVKHLKKLIQELPGSVRFMFLQAPILEDGENITWDGKWSTHILEVGWKQVGMMLGEQGFKPSFSVPEHKEKCGSVKVFVRGICE
jgi:hypothetical protein